MEGNVFDVFRALAGVFTWGLPVMLILALVIFIVAIPTLALAGAVLRIRDAIGGKKHLVYHKDPQVAALERLWR
ncbi:MAG: hypothetical protein Q8O43_02945 [Dehalococcoidia bacterium]|nr:hypothetical protein [Dehalococcoidia bacterium]